MMIWILSSMVRPGQMKHSKGWRMSALVVMGAIQWAIQGRNITMTITTLLTTRTTAITMWPLPFPQGLFLLLGLFDLALEVPTHMKEGIRFSPGGEEKTANFDLVLDDLRKLYRSRVNDPISMML
jgi:hypothetical protein